MTVQAGGGAICGLALGTVGFVALQLVHRVFVLPHIQNDSGQNQQGAQSADGDQWAERPQRAGQNILNDSQNTHLDYTLMVVSIFMTKILVTRNAATTRQAGMKYGVSITPS